MGFLLPRIIDCHQIHLSDRDAIARGMADTKRIITGAALIMVTVFVAVRATGPEFMQGLGIRPGIAITPGSARVRGPRETR